MKTGIHPDYRPVVFQDANTGTAFLTRSTAHTDRTVVWEIVDTEGRVEKFERRYGRRTRRGPREG